MCQRRRLCLLSEWADILAGGTGNDNYVIDDAGDVVTELANEGNDTLQTYLISTRPVGQRREPNSAGTPQRQRHR